MNRQPTQWQPLQFKLGRNPRSQVIVFRQWQRASRHLRKHVLARTEFPAWDIIDPEFASLYGKLSQWPRRPRLQQHPTFAGLWDDLYQIYARQIRIASRQAEELDWLVEWQNKVYGFGVSGVMFVIDVQKRPWRVRTAFIPGTGTFMDYASELGALAGDHPKPLRRDRKPGRRRDFQKPLIHRVDKSHRRQWSHKERHFHLVFKPAMQFIRKHQASKRRCGQYGILKQKLGLMSRMDYDHWLELLARFEK